MRQAGGGEGWGRLGGIRCKHLLECVCGEVEREARMDDHEVALDVCTDRFDAGERR